MAPTAEEAARLPVIQCTERTPLFPSLHHTAAILNKINLMMSLAGSDPRRHGYRYSFYDWKKTQRTTNWWTFLSFFVLSFRYNRKDSFNLADIISDIKSNVYVEMQILGMYSVIYCTVCPARAETELRSSNRRKNTPIIFHSNITNMCRNASVFPDGVVCVGASECGSAVGFRGGRQIHAAYTVYVRECESVEKEVRWCFCFLRPRLIKAITRFSGLARCGSAGRGHKERYFTSWKWLSWKTHRRRRTPANHLLFNLNKPPICLTLSITSV